MANEPPAVKVPYVNLFLYLYLSISGAAKIPIVAQPAALEPETAAKIPLAKMVAIPNPPFLLPNHATQASNKSLLNPAFKMTSPIRINRGIAISVKLFIEDQAMIAAESNASNPPPRKNNPPIPNNPRQKFTGIPAPSISRKTMTITAVIISYLPRFDFRPLSFSNHALSFLTADPLKSALTSSIAQRII